ncbi:MAG: PTS sugar transporter subunit IIA [Mariprofundaceae bacterium]
MALLPAEHVILDSRARSKRALITELAQVLSSIDPDQIMEVVMAREHLGSTGIGHGVAIPLGRMPGLTHPELALVRHSTGVDFGAFDGVPVHIAVLLLVPDADDRAHLELLARLARSLQRERVRRGIMEAPDAEHIIALLEEAVGD